MVPHSPASSTASVYQLVPPGSNTSGKLRSMPDAVNNNPGDLPPEAAVSLLDLPGVCLHNIISFMDGASRLEFFRASKGTHDRPGCAALVLASCKATFSYTDNMYTDQPAPVSLHWAAQLSTGISLILHDIDDDYPRLVEVLHRVLLCRGDQELMAYPGVTSLNIQGMTSSSLEPHLLRLAFPNLTSLTVQGWLDERGRTEHPMPPTQELPHLTFLSVYPYSKPLVQHVGQLLCHLPSLTSLITSMEVLFATSAPSLAQLTSLCVSCPTSEIATFHKLLPTCTQLRRLILGFGTDDKAVSRLLPAAVPQLRELCVAGTITDAIMPHLLDLKHLTAITAISLDITNDYSRAACDWRSLTFSTHAYEGIAKLPLHSLDRPIPCGNLMMLSPSPDHAADMSAIQVAKPHLVRCGGITSTVLVFDSFSLSLTQQQAVELLEAWAPCLPAVTRVRARGNAVWKLIHAAVTRLWPGAVLDQ